MTRESFTHTSVCFQTATWVRDSEKASPTGPAGAVMYQHAPFLVAVIRLLNAVFRNVVSSGTVRSSLAICFVPRLRASADETPRVPTRLATSTPYGGSVNTM